MRTIWTSVVIAIVVALLVSSVLLARRASLFCPESV